MVEIFYSELDEEVLQFFEGLDEVRASAFLNEYLQLQQERFLALRSRYLQVESNCESDLDFSPDSLKPLWGWAAIQFRRREFTDQEKKHFVNLPENCRKFFKPTLDRKSLVLLNDVSYYFSEVLIRFLDGLFWQVCKTTVKRYIDRNQPVLGGFSSPGFELGVNPRRHVKILALKAVDGEIVDNALIDEFEFLYRLVEPTRRT